MDNYEYKERHKKKDKAKERKGQYTNRHIRIQEKIAEKHPVQSTSSDKK